MLVFTNILFTWLLIKQLAGQNVESKIVTIGLIITLLVMTSYRLRRKAPTSRKAWDERSES